LWALSLRWRGCASRTLREGHTRGVRGCWSRASDLSRVKQRIHPLTSRFTVPVRQFPIGVRRRPRDGISRLILKRVCRFEADIILYMSEVVGIARQSAKNTHKGRGGKQPRQHGNDEESTHAEVSRGSLVNWARKRNEERATYHLLLRPRRFSRSVKSRWRKQYASGRVGPGRAGRACGTNALVADCAAEYVCIRGAVPTGSTDIVDRLGYLAKNALGVACVS